MQYTCLFFVLSLVVATSAQASVRQDAPSVFYADETTRNRDWAKETDKAAKDPTVKFIYRCYPEQNICIKAYVTKKGDMTRVLREETDLSGVVLVRGMCDCGSASINCFNWDTGQMVMTGTLVNGNWMFTGAH